MSKTAQRRRNPVCQGNPPPKGTAPDQQISNRVRAILLSPTMGLRPESHRGSRSGDPRKQHIGLCFECVPSEHADSTWEETSIVMAITGENAPAHTYWVQLPVLHRRSMTSSHQPRPTKQLGP